MMQTFFLQAQPNAGIMQLVLLGGMVLVFYFFMIRPQSQKAKKAKKFQ
jgi:preprotein translocase subunit YajC